MEVLWSHLIKPLLDSVEAKRIVEISSDVEGNTKNLLSYAESIGGTVVVLDSNPIRNIDELVSKWAPVLDYRKTASLDALPFIDKYDVILIDGDHNWFSVFHELEAIHASSKNKSFPFPLVLLHDVSWPYANRDMYLDPERIPEEFRHSWEYKGMSPDSAALVASGGLNDKYCNAVHEGGERNGVLGAVNSFLTSHKGEYGFKLVSGFHGLGILFDPRLRKQKPKFESFLSLIKTPKPISDQLEALEQARVRSHLNALEFKAERDREYLHWRKLDQKIQETAEKLRLRRLGSPGNNLDQVLDAVVKRSAEAEFMAARSRKLKQASEQARRQLDYARRDLDRHQRSEVRLLERLDRAELYGCVAVVNARRVELLDKGNGLRKDIELKQNWIVELISHYETAMFSFGWRVGAVLFGKFGNQISLVTSRMQPPWAPNDAASVIADFRVWRTDKQDLSVSSETLLIDWLEEYRDAWLTPELVQELKRVLEAEEHRIARLERVDSSLSAWFHNLLSSLECIYSSKRFRFAKWAIDKGVKRIFRKPSLLDSLPLKTQTVRSQYEGCVRMMEAAQAVQESFSAEYPERLKAQARPLVIQYIPDTPKNPYYTMIPRKLSERGWNIEYDHQPKSVEKRLEFLGGTGCVVHFHQLEPYYHSKQGDPEETKEQSLALVEQIRKYKDMGAKLVWTSHNPLPHERSFDTIDKEVISSVLPMMDEVVVLGRNAKADFHKKWAHSSVSIVRHPSYQLQYGAKIGRTIARDSLELAQDSVLLGHISRIVPYKGLELVIEAFQLAQQSLEQKATLLIAGEAPDADYVESLKEKAGPDIVFCPGFLNDYDLRLLLGALDASLFAFKDIWASGSVVLSLSYGVPVIAPRIGCIPEYVSHGNNGFLYEHGSAPDFAEKISEFLEVPELFEHFDYMCDRFNREFNLNAVAHELEEVYLRAAQR
jgi:glycosyltransferase involved in cell wall biosynthesis